MNRMLGILLVVLWVGCERSEADAPIEAADTIMVDRQRCILPPHFSASADLVAVRCAEIYVVRNGYTDLAPVPDSSQWVGEFMDLGMDYRRRELERHASALCRFTGGDLPPVLVIFRRAPPAPEGARAVALEADLSYMKIMHQDAKVPAENNPDSSCVLLR